MKKIFLSLLLLAQFSLADDFPKRIEELPQKEMISQNKLIINLFVEEISKTLPKEIDKYTRLSSVTSKDLTLIYIFEINAETKSDEAIQKEDKTRMKNSVTQGICQSSKRFLDAQVNISYLYLSAKTKAELFRFDVTQTDCINL
ncbi:MAG TPA: hypothetical protein CFH84_04380 [Sulfurimonas sp. UBA12504]|nr:MAG: hypothetical protein A2019_09825 [Sulfurimonas sp. GWF2_37_8]DAB30378.1 MAG TPA: hypothetical protein CFH84_04380 [Sulfurimonas sp. UBA12504]